MKLSEILGWPDKQKEYFGVNTVQAGEAFGHNTALTSCDREIDKEALADNISNALCDCKEDPSTGERSQCRFCYDIKGYEKDLADYIISTMPKWLKRSEYQAQEGKHKDNNCPTCGGDGIERCDNPDHGFIDAVGGEIGRLGCPCCGHDQYRRINGSKCPDCHGTGKLKGQDNEKI